MPGMAAMPSPAQAATPSRSPALVHLIEGVWRHTPAQNIAFLELVWTESTRASGFFLKKNPPSATLKKSICIPKMLLILD
jgi:hypothetical protein